MARVKVVAPVTSICLRFPHEISLKGIHGKRSGACGVSEAREEPVCIEADDGLAAGAGEGAVLGTKGTGGKAAVRDVSVLRGGGLSRRGGVLQRVVVGGGRWGVEARPCTRARAQQSTAPDRLQPTLLRRCGFRRQVSASVRCQGSGDKPSGMPLRLRGSVACFTSQSGIQWRAHCCTAPPIPLNKEGD